MVAAYVSRKNAANDANVGPDSFFVSWRESFGSPRGVSGLELAAMLRGNPVTQAVPVVVVSATGGARVGNR